MSDDESETPITVIKPSLEDITSGKVNNPKTVEVITRMWGGFNILDKGIKIHTKWKVDYNHQEIHFIEGIWNPGDRDHILPPKRISKRHKILVRKIGALVFSRKSFKKLRMYGHWNIHQDTIIVAKAGKKIMLVSDKQDAEIWAALIGLKEYTTEELPILKVKSDFYKHQKPSALIELARENSLTFRHYVLNFLEDIMYGEEAKKNLKELGFSQDELSYMWEKVYSSKCPSILY